MSDYNTNLPNDRSDQVTDPFLLSLLNHITLPPQAPQSVSSPNDLYMSDLGWSPQAIMLAGQQYSSGQYNPPTSYTESSYINQAHLMGMNPAQPDTHTTDDMGPSAPRNNTNQSLDNTWNGYFGSS
jgi:hypothetical protein